MEYGGAEGGTWDGLSPEVLDMILQHLPLQDLLSCSLVSRNWKKAARDVLKRSRECYAHIKYFHQDIQDLNQMIASTEIMEMINGLHIRNETRPEEEPERDSLIWEFSGSKLVEKILRSREAGRKLDEAKKKISSVLGGRWRYLDLDMGYAVSLGKGLLLREIVLATSDTLQKLVVRVDNDWKFIPCCAKPFPKLKVIQSHVLGGCDNHSLSNFAPNLEKITGAMMKLYVQLPGEKFGLERMKSIKVAPGIAVPQGEAREILGCVSGLHQLDLQHYNYVLYHRNQDLPSWRSLVLPFVLRSLDTLQELSMYTLDLYNLSMASDGLKFPNLRRLSLAAQQNVSMTNEISVLKNLNLPNVCPKLEQLELTKKPCLSDVQQEVIPVQGPDELVQSNLPMRIALTCRDGQYNHEYLRFLSTIYPKIKKLRILSLRSVDDYDVSKIFWDLQSLEYLEISVPDPLRDIEFHIEALLSGINIEEAQAQLPSLKSQRKKQMLNLCVVPIRPSLLNAKSLKELKITVDSHWKTTSWVTQVTENFPERHVRNLKLTVNANNKWWDRLVRMRALTWLRAKEIRA